jgi:hypothetical protein
MPAEFAGSNLAVRGSWLRMRVAGDEALLETALVFQRLG